MPNQSLTDLETPALVVALDALDHNIREISAWISGRGKHWRPHAKSHSSPAIVHKQMQAGAIGATAATVTEAESLAAGGVRDLLIAHCVADESKCDRVAALCDTAVPIVCCDHYAQAELLSAACRRRGVTCRVLLDVNIGLHRTGIRPGPDAVDLAKGLLTLPGIQLCGVMGYEGHLLTLADPARKRDEILRALAVLDETTEQLRRIGVNVEIISAGGTGSYQSAADAPGVTELQAGGGIFGCPFYTEVCGVVGLRPALSVVATVVSRPSLTRAILDCGRKTIAGEVHPPRVIARVDGPPLPDAEVTLQSAEHWTLELGPDSRNLTIGDRVLVRPGYGDLTIHRHRQIWGVRNGRVEEVFPVAGRR
jgi:D-serine deaminase-like pyridoxal phosphate-dependent protein